MKTASKEIILFWILSLIVASLTYIFLTAVTVVVASTHYNATITGYAFGGTSASGYTLTQWSFANHPPGTMCNGSRDWSGDWAWGTRIVMDQSVIEYDSNNNPYSRKSFWLHDNGDPSCIKGMNWMDLHFGRYKENPTTNCNCSGVPVTQCLTGSNNVNNCVDAVYFGSSTRGYTKY